MNTPATAAQPENVIALKLPRKQPAKLKPRFSVTKFINRTGSISWRVTGIKRDRSRIRENFQEEPAARCRCNELEIEYLGGHTETAVQATKLTPDQLRTAEAAFIQLGEDWPRLVDAVMFWKAHGQHQTTGESPRIDEAAEQFTAWLDSKDCGLRLAYKVNLKSRVNTFRNSVPNVRMSEITPEFIESFLAKRKVTPATKNTDKLMVSAFLSWCIERPRRWMTGNPCAEIKVRQDDQKPPPEVLAVEQCEALLRAAEAHKDGKALPYVVLCLVAGLRPSETAKISWSQINLKDRQIIVHKHQSKVKRSRTIPIWDALLAWLKACKGKDIFPPNLAREFDSIREAANLNQWTDDVMRHTAVSHYFRMTESYGKTAEVMGNSETVIKDHYQGRATSEDTKKFYALKPKK